MKDVVTSPERVELIGDELCLVWKDGEERYFKADFLRERSPSAEVAGERDIFGTQYGGEAKGTKHEGVSIEGWEIVGNYAMRILFSDGHQTGLYSWAYLRGLETVS